jgi:hypothetical protein
MDYGRIRPPKPGVALAPSHTICWGVRRHLFSRPAALLLVPLALGGTVPELRAQRSGDSTVVGKVTHPKPRSLVLGIAGVIIGGLAGFGFSRGGKQPGAGMTVVGAAAGGLAGFFIGRQFDERRAVTYRGAPSLRIPNVAIELEGEPSALAVRDSEAAVGGSTGVQLFSATDPRLMPLGHRAAGLHGVDALALAPGTGWLAIGSRTGLYLYPPIRGPGILVGRAGVNAIAAADTRIFVGVDDRVEIVPVSADSARSWPGTSLGAPVRDVALDEVRAIVWASTDRELVALRISGDSLVKIGSLPLPGIGLRMVIDQGVAAVAMGEKGVSIFDITDPTQPKQRAVWTGARFAYDVSIDGSRMFVAAGPEGVYLVDLGTDGPRTIGLARSLGFASALISHDHHTFILDRRTNALRRIISTY